MRIKDLKLQYREQYSELQMVKSEVEYTQQLCDTCAREILMEFNEWYGGKYGMDGGGEMALSAGLNAGDDDSEGALSPSAKSQAGSSIYSGHSSAMRTAAGPYGIRGAGSVGLVSTSTGAALPLRLPTAAQGRSPSNPRVGGLGTATPGTLAGGRLAARRAVAAALVQPDEADAGAVKPYI